MLRVAKRPRDAAVAGMYLAGYNLQIGQFGRELQNLGVSGPTWYYVGRGQGTLLRKGAQLARHVLPGVVKPMRILWNEVIGFLFLALAVIAFPHAYRSLRAFSGDGESLFRTGLSVCFTLIMLFFGVSSFLRARRISRS